RVPRRSSACGGIYRPQSPAWQRRRKDQAHPSERRPTRHRHSFPTFLQADSRPLANPLRSCRKRIIPPWGPRSGPAPPCLSYPPSMTLPKNIMLALPVEHTYQGEQATRGIEIDHHLSPESFHQNPRTVVMNRAPAHIDGFDLVGSGGPNRLIVTVADHVVVLD